MKKFPQQIDYRQEFLEEIGSFDHAVIEPIDHHFDAYMALLEHGDIASGMCLPWEKTHGRFRLRTSEVTLWAGYSGSGKSAMLGQIMTELALCGAKVLVASFEMPPARLIERHCAQVEGRKLVKGEKSRALEILAMTDGAYFVYTQTEAMDPERVMGMISYAAREFGVKHFVIDSLVKCGIRRQPDFDENLQNFMDTLQVLAKRYDIGIHLVHHMRKPADHGYIPCKHDIKHAGELADLADNVVLIWRNKPKENNMPTDEIYDTLLIVDKQRHGHRWEGRIGLNFNREAGSWYE